MIFYPPPPLLVFTQAVRGPSEPLAKGQVMINGGLPPLPADRDRKRPTDVSRHQLSPSEVHRVRSFSLFLRLSFCICTFNGAVSREGSFDTRGSDTFAAAADQRTPRQMVSVALATTHFFLSALHPPPPSPLSPFPPLPSPPLPRRWNNEKPNSGHG